MGPKKYSGSKIRGTKAMYPKWLNRLTDNFEKLLIWLTEGGKYPFGNRDHSNRSDLSNQGPEKK
jgi:hypothetical protein